MICDVNWDTHRAHTHVYRSTTDATTHRDPVGFVSTSLSIRDALPSARNRAALSASHNAILLQPRQRPAFKSPRHRGTSRVQGVAFNTLLGLPGLPLVCVPQAEAPLVITHQINDKKHK
jgi:hypothetical protein